MPTAMIACCFSTNEFFTRNSTVVFVEMVYESKLLLTRLLSCLDGWFSLFLPILSLLSQIPPEFIFRHLILYEGKYMGQSLWENWQSTVTGMDFPAWNGAKSPNWSTTIPILALHEVETPPTPPKSIHMVSGVMLVEGYRMRQQSAVVMVSEYLPSFETTRKSGLEMTNHVSTLHCTGDLFEVLWTFLLCIWVSTYGNSFGRNDNLPLLGPIYLTSFKPPAGQEGHPRQLGPCEWPYDCVHTKVDPHFFCFGTLKVSESV
jgi:hypothetical protein